MSSSHNGHRRRRGSWLQLGSPHGFEWNRLDLPVRGLPAALQSLRIIHLTDTHVTGRWYRAYDRLIEALREDPPDLILFTGDFVDHVLDARPALPVVERLMTQLTARLGIYAITGNHDGDLLGPRLPGWGVHYIAGQYIRLETHEAALELVGLPGVRRMQFDPDFITHVPPRQIGVPRLILGHFPDQITLVQPLAADVMLTGHTHGGQICLPKGRALITHDTLPKHMARGIHRVGETLLVVNRGFGMTRWSIRLFCPAEVIELRLVGDERQDAKSPRL